MNTNIIMWIFATIYVISFLIVDIVDIRAYKRLNERLDDIEEKYKGGEK